MVCESSGKRDSDVVPARLKLCTIMLKVWSTMVCWLSVGLENRVYFKLPQPTRVSVGPEQMFLERLQNLKNLNPKPLNPKPPSHPLNSRDWQTLQREKT